MFGLSMRRIIESETKARGNTPKAKAEAYRLFSLKLKEAFKDDPSLISKASIREIAEACLGNQWLKGLNPYNKDVNIEEMGLQEADAVDLTGFSSITGQIVYTAIHQGYQNEGFVGESLVTNIPTRLQTERVPGMGGISDEALEVKEGMPFPFAGFGESYQDTPQTKKYGLAIGLTKEAIFFDRTGIFVLQAQKIGERVKRAKDKRIFRVIIGATNNYNWRGLSLNTYLSTLTPGLWVNDHVNTLIDWKSIDAIKQLMQAIKDPETGDRIMVNGMQLLVTPFNSMTASRILNATQVIEKTRTSSASDSLVNMVSGNPLPSGIQMIESGIMEDLLVSDLALAQATARQYFYMGDFKRAFAYMENWPLTVQQAAKDNTSEFERDIVMQWRASERGEAAVWDPRYVVRSRPS